VAKPVSDMNSEPTVSQLFDLSGRVALITGASGHLGRSMSAALAEAGARVVVASRQREAGEKIAASLAGAQKGCHLSVVMDHMDESSIQHGFDEAVAVAGKIQILVCNGHEALAADWTSVTAAQFTRQLQNATGYFLLARKMRDHAANQAVGASVIVVGSMYGVVGSYPEVYEGINPANPVAYQVLKGGLAQMVRHLAVYWARDGVRVNCLSPGPFPAPSAPAALVERLESRSPMSRIGKPHELKGALVFLASDASSYVTGQNLLIDGGWTAW
jgi:NAD(P)-dependent dehydrogenase (short-subunit alcohol dehydrogenase family)